MPVKSCLVVAVKNSSNPNIIRKSEADEVTSFEFRDLSSGSGHKKPKTKVTGTQTQLTAAALERIQEQARQEAYEQGRKEGFEFGHNEAREQYRHEFEKRLQLLDSFLKKFEQPFTDLDDQVENEIVDLVISMVKQLVRREVKMDPNQIIGVVREAMSILPVSSRAVTLVLNPADAELIREAFSLADKEQAWKIIEDPVLNRGGCKVLAEDSQVDATLESRLDALIAPLLSDERTTLSDDEPDERS